MSIVLIEPASVPDIYVSGLSHIDLVGGGCASFVCYRNQIEEDGKVFKVPRVNIIMPMTEIPDAIRKALLVPVHEILGVRRLRPLWMH